MKTTHKLGIGQKRGLSYELSQLFAGPHAGHLFDASRADANRQTFNAPATNATAAGDPVGLMLPAQAPEGIVNNLIWTDTPNNAIWTGTATTTLNARNDAGGSPLASLLTAIATSSSRDQAFTCTADTAVRMASVDLEAGTATFSQLFLIYSGGLTYSASIAWSGGVPTVTHGDSATAADVGATLQATGIYRVWVKGANTSRTTCTLAFRCSSPGSSATGNCYASRFMVHEGSTLVAYQPNAGCLGGSNRRSGGANLLLWTQTLATQNVTTIAQAYTLSFAGTGTVTLSGTSTAGPLIGTGVSDRVTLTFTPTAGTLTLTVTGTVTDAQLQIGSAFTTYSRNLDQLGGLITNFPLYQTTTANRVTLARWPANGIYNLFTTAAATFSTRTFTTTAVQYTLSFKGTGTVTLSGTSTAGPLIGTGASDRVSLTFTPTAGTLTLTLTGSATEGMINFGATALTYQDVVSATDITESGQPYNYGYWGDGTSDTALTGLQAFGSATLCAQAGNDFTLIGYVRTLTKDRTIGPAQASATAGNRTWQAYAHATTGQLSTICRGTITNLTTEDLTNGNFQVIGFRCVSGVVQAWSNKLAAQSVTAGSVAIEAQEIMLWARTLSAPGQVLPGHQAWAFLDRGVSDSEMAAAMANLCATVRPGL